MESRLKTIVFFSLALIFSFYGQTFADLNDGLVAYYPFNGNANDYSGNGNNGTVIGATLVNDRFGNLNSAYSFDGISNYIAVDHSTDFNFGTAVTYSVWIYPNLNHNAAFVEKFVPSLEDKQLYFWGNFIYFHLSGVTRVNDLSDVMTEPGSVQANEWCHVVTTYNGNYANIYLNGVLKVSKQHSGDIRDSTGTLYFGGNPIRIENGKPVAYFNGYIDDIRIYNRSLSEPEINELYGLPINFTNCDIDGDGITGLEEAIHALQVAAGIK